MRKVTLRQRAAEDLIDIWTYIATDKPEAADRLLDALERRWAQLTRHPRLGVARDDIMPGLRHLVTGAYITLYLVDDGHIDILRVLHGRRRIDARTVRS
ncbi:type II toxin-antitoxin system RelE/ParE family toxin [Zavarzinia compransoris]|uniref:Plasmid stabilization protein n=1 Tax=Zavarzinia compransoris TaxID=1264899 RepID=A0A317E6K3_9PROT|nr:type II toxin-antitoxin system RelE/ParE family toxin [Zavarzinia compransoris]PWR21890.1 plasmid stabilization protein [Zavarzinia compransoris]TDP45304.1 toxin ParE1/3/4 [Zavarzinia compransoris]